MGKGCVLCPPVWPKNKQTSDAIFSVINDIKLKEMAPKDVVSQDDAQWFIAGTDRYRGRTRESLAWRGRSDRQGCNK